MESQTLAILQNVASVEHKLPWKLSLTLWKQPRSDKYIYHTYCSQASTTLHQLKLMGITHHLRIDAHNIQERLHTGGTGRKGVS